MVVWIKILSYIIITFRSDQPAPAAPPSQQPLLQRLGHGFGAGVDLELFVDVAHVGVDGVDADVEEGGDLLFDVAVHHELEDAFFPGREAVVLFGGDQLGEHGEDPAGDAAVHGGAAGEDVVDGGGDLLDGGGFQEVAGGAGADGAEDFAVVLENREDEEGGAGGGLTEAAQALDAVHAGEADVQEDDVRGDGGGGGGNEAGAGGGWAGCGG